MYPAPWQVSLKQDNQSSSPHLSLVVSVMADRCMPFPATCFLWNQTKVIHIPSLLLHEDYNPQPIIKHYLSAQTGNTLFDQSLIIICIFSSGLIHSKSNSIFFPGLKFCKALMRSIAINRTEQDAAKSTRELSKIKSPHAFRASPQPGRGMDTVLDSCEIVKIFQLSHLIRHSSGVG